MAVITETLSEIVTRGDHGHIVIWGPLAAGDEGRAISMIGSARRTVQVIGAFGGGSKLAMEGSNDATNFSTLTDEHGNPLVFNQPGISTVSELTLWIRPRVSAGNPGATVKMLMRKTEAR